ncbi:hypothetical protein CCACVL1_00822 [Corchorus capsularis]|uniref:Uncharacterized protein n=1 Tax=Corchorus capsularis TaxID=210143 RepID=A0A1R3KUB5_COCAP|nr:hypothetical protein CCACVL1_00822 [Corchorus capsularis]
MRRKKLALTSDSSSEDEGQ